MLPIFRSIVPAESSTAQTVQPLPVSASWAVCPAENLCSCGGNQKRRTTDRLTHSTISPPVSPPSASGSPISSAGLNVRR